VSKVWAGYLFGFIQAGVLAVFIALLCVHPHDEWEIGVALWGTFILMSWGVMVVAWVEE
jgi:hypothetical protein